MSKPLCERCGKPIPSRRIERAEARGTTARFCSENCRTAAKQARYRSREPRTLQDLVHLRNLAAHGMIVEKILLDPALIRDALDTLDRWEQQRGSLPAFREWREILSEAEIASKRDPRALITLARILLDPSEDGMRRRSSSPFSGALSQEERDVLFSSERTS